MAIYFYNEKIDFKLKNKAKLKLWLKHIAQLEKKTIGTLNFIFTSDEELLQKNKQFLNHNTLTDIITFDYCEDNKLTGDIFISIERISENAKKFNVAFEEELHRVIIHGTLHLCGYKDKTKPTADLMRKKEDWALGKLVV
jgi:rRNA maturation RNase YbeY